MKMKRTLKKICGWCFFLALVLVRGQGSFAEEINNIAKNPHVLVLSSYSYEWESNPKQLAGIVDTLNGYAKIDYVFMDTKRLKYEDVKKVSIIVSLVARKVVNMIML